MRMDDSILENEHYKTYLKHTTIMSKRVFNLIILDASGSMFSIRQQAISGVNETIQTIRQAQKDHPELEQVVSFVWFNTTETRTVYDCSPIAEVRELTKADYVPDACTPLYDAVGNALSALRKHVGKDDAVLVSIITDGLENASREYSSKAILDMVNDLSKQGWVFTYIGANQDVFKVAHDMGIKNAMAFEATVSGSAKMFSEEQRSRKLWFSKVASNDCSAAELQSNYFKED